MNLVLAQSELAGLALGAAFIVIAFAKVAGHARTVTVVTFVLTILPALAVYCWALGSFPRWVLNGFILVCTCSVAGIGFRCLQLWRHWLPKYIVMVHLGLTLLAFGLLLELLCQKRPATAPELYTLQRLAVPWGVLLAFWGTMTWPNPPSRQANRHYNITPRDGKSSDRK